MTTTDHDPRQTPAPPTPPPADTSPTVRSRRPALPDPPRVAIIGGGLAGLAAAVALADCGLRITILESRPRLGGRASSFTDPATGGLVDNCQHVSMGCCTNLADFCDRVGTRALFRPLPSVRFLAPDAPPSTWTASRLPAPFHLTPAFLGSRFLKLGEKLQIAWGLAVLRYASGDDPRPFADWLAAHRQSPRVQRRFWATVLVSALNEQLDRMDVGHARQVFIDGFLRNRSGHVVEVPAAPLGSIYGEALEAWLTRRGAEIRLSSGVARIDVDADGALSGLRLRDGSRLDADFVVSTVPFNRVGELIDPADQHRLPQLDDLQRIHTTPITGIHLWFDRRVCPVDHAVLIDRTIQWVFDHSTDGKSGTEPGEQYLQLVVSASYDLAKLDNAAILDIALADLAAIWPEATRDRLLRSRVVTEHGATFSARPGIDRLRPPQRTPIEGLYLAGDWTLTGWPATMEGAVRSGYLAAEGILADLSRPTRLLQPDLPSGRLARWLIGPPRPSRPHPLPFASTASR